MNKYIEKTISAVITLSVPIVISVISILFLLSPLFINLEYHRPGFPPDHYGFTTQERLKFGTQTRRYLVTGMTLDDLKQLKFEDGEPIYMERELKHLEDVKIVLKGVLNVFWLALFIIILGAVFAYIQKGWVNYKRAISKGGWLTAGLLGLILLLSIVSFQALFTNFHLLFFEGDSWLFYFSDTLIRLFPIRFWQDVFLVFGITTLGGGLLMGWLLRDKERRIS
jgi:integral membrane protein (TIGR01906 family)